MDGKINFDLRSALHIFDYNTAESYGTLHVLLCLTLHANIRNRAYPTMRTLIKETGIASASVVKAIEWLIKTKAIEIVEYDLRVGKEKTVARNRNVYQLTGDLEVNGIVYKYLWYNNADETDEDVSARETSVVSARETSKVELVSADETYKQYRKKKTPKEETTPSDDSLQLSRLVSNQSSDSNSLPPLTPVPRTPSPSKKRASRTTKDGASDKVLGELEKAIGKIYFKYHLKTMPWTEQQVDRIEAMALRFQAALNDRQLDLTPDCIMEFVNWYSDTYKDSSGRPWSLPQLDKVENYITIWLDRTQPPVNREPSQPRKRLSEYGMRTAT